MFGSLDGPRSLYSIILVMITATAVGIQSMFVNRFDLTLFIVSLYCENFVCCKLVKMNVSRLINTDS